MRPFNSRPYLGIDLEKVDPETSIWNVWVSVLWTYHSARKTVMADHGWEGIVFRDISLYYSIILHDPLMGRR